MITIIIRSAFENTTFFLERKNSAAFRLRSRGYESVLGAGDDDFAVKVLHFELVLAAALDDVTGDLVLGAVLTELEETFH